MERFGPRHPVKANNAQIADDSTKVTAASVFVHNSDDGPIIRYNDLAGAKEPVHERSKQIRHRAIVLWSVIAAIHDYHTIW